jgi:hypothetical protein
VGSWYWIGVCAGLGVAVGVLLVGLVGATRVFLGAAVIAAAALGVLVGFGLGQTDEAIGGGAGGVLGALGAAQIVAGTLRRGGGRFGTAIFVGIGALVPGGCPRPGAGGTPAPSRARALCRTALPCPRLRARCTRARFRSRSS